MGKHTDVDGDGIADRDDFVTEDGSTYIRIDPDEFEPHVEEVSDGLVAERLPGQ